MTDEYDSNLFSKQYKSISNTIYKVQEETKEVLSCVFKEESLSLPIDVYKIAKYYNIEILEKDLSSIPHIKTNRVLGRLVKDNEDRFHIEVDKNVDSFTQRYSIAHEIGHYLLIQKERGDVINGVYSMPLLSSCTKEYFIDAYSIFLVLPLEKFFEEFSRFLRIINAQSNNEHHFSFSVDDWLTDLSAKIQIPNYNLSFSYDYIRMAAFQHYEKIKDLSLIDQWRQYIYLFF